MALHGDTRIKVYENNQYKLVPIKKLAGTKPIIMDARGIQSEGICYKLPKKMECIQTKIWQEKYYENEPWKTYRDYQTIITTPNHQIFSFLESLEHEEMVLYYANQTIETVNPNVKISSDFRYIFCNEYAIESKSLENSSTIFGKTTSTKNNWALYDDLWQISSSEKTEKSKVFTIKTLTHSFETEFIHVKSY